ncbi:MAG: hypothetical protein UX62_C0046G0016 [Microgenomates group bacterium GW2011_GWA2_46_7]|nr:MAG: hypothetical protein UX62_C0046G0016 [Microgenomates group bacterium GW2011_GWA2_46_7]KKU46597.1 MAG: hypothetical protein UX64_C0005G0014 [Microgenomates group bacterium GW2011_GWC2_46_7]
MGVWQNVGQNLAGLAKHVAKKVVAEPVEIVRDVIGQNIEHGQQTKPQNDDPNQNNPANDLAKAGFKTKEDFQKYQGLSGKKDEMELSAIRGRLVREWGLDTGIESGMQRARAEWEQKEEQRKKVEEKKVEQKKEFEFEKKKQEDLALKVATSEASAENKAWGAG